MNYKFLVILVCFPTHVLYPKVSGSMVNPDGNPVPYVNLRNEMVYVGNDFITTIEFIDFEKTIRGIISIG